MVSRFIACALLCFALTGCHTFHVYEPRMCDLIERMLEHERQKEMAARKAQRSVHRTAAL